MKTLRLSAMAMAAAVGISGAASATELTIAIVNNGHSCPADLRRS